MCWPILRRLLVSLAVVCLGGGALLLWSMPSSGKGVLVVAHPLNAGERTDTGALIVRQTPEDLTPADALSSPQSLPEVWHGPRLEAGTIITESLIDGSPGGRALRPGVTRISVLLDPLRVPEVASGDVVDVWATPKICDENVCLASLISREVEIVSYSSVDSTQWSGPVGVRLELLVRDADIDKVLGHAGAGTLSLVLRSREVPAPGS